MKANAAQSDKPKPVAGRSPSANVQTLAIDIGGTGLKAAVLNAKGEMVTDRARVETPHPCPPKVLLKELGQLIAPLPHYDRVSVGFPGVVRHGKILTAANLGDEVWGGFDLATALAKQVGKPVRVLNDADVQGLGAISGQGVELVITLGTGFGSSLFEDGRLAPHLELGHHPFRKGETYEEQLGNEARQEVGSKRWNRRVRQAIETLRMLTTFDHLYLGGGNAAKLNFELPPDVSVVSNECGMKGGIGLWRDDMWQGRG